MNKKGLPRYESEMIILEYDLEVRKKRTLLFEAPLSRNINKLGYFNKLWLDYWCYNLTIV